MTGTSNKELAALRAYQVAGPSGLLPISLAGWWAGVKSGHYPQPIKLSPRVTVWRREDIMALLADNNSAQGTGQ